MVLVQEKNDLTLQLQAVSPAPVEASLHITSLEQLMEQPEGTRKRRTTCSSQKNFSHRDRFPGTSVISKECSRSFDIKMERWRAVAGT